jgi:serine/threonine protein kinase
LATMQDAGGADWGCSNLGVVLRIASRLHPRIAVVTAAATDATADPFFIHPTPTRQPPQPSCGLCSAFMSVLPCHIDELSAVCYAPRGHADGSAGPLYTCQPLRSILDTLKDDHRDPFEVNGCGLLPVDIGCGGDGRVILGSHRQTPVAIKVITVGSERDHAPSKVERRMKALLSEATVGALVHRHQNAATAGASSLSRLTGVTVMCGHPRRGHTVILVQSYYQLGSFDRLVHRRRRQQGLTRSSSLPRSPLLTQRECASLLASMCRSLQFLHDTVDVVHRDVKPANMLLFSGENDDAKHNGSVTVVLGDLGLTRESASVKTTCGTPKFMAPELVIPTALFPSFRSAGSTATSNSAPGSGRAKGAPYGPPVDIFGLGISIQYAVSGGAVDAVRRYWVAPSTPHHRGPHNISASPRKVPTIAPVGGIPALEAFTLPQTWCCSKRNRCDCDCLHDDFIALLNRMVNPNPALRPSASCILNEVASMPCMQRTHTKLRDHLHHITNNSAGDAALSSFADMKGNVECVVGPSLTISNEEILALLPASDALRAARVGVKEEAPSPPPPPPSPPLPPPPYAPPVTATLSSVVVSPLSTWTASASALAITPSVHNGPQLLTKRLSGKGFEDYVAYFTPPVKVVPSKGGDCNSSKTVG